MDRSPSQDPPVKNTAGKVTLGTSTSATGAKSLGQTTAGGAGDTKCDGSARGGKRNVNRGIKGDSSSRVAKTKNKFPGVSLDKKTQKWCFSFERRRTAEKRQRIYKGGFESQEAAADAREVHPVAAHAVHEAWADHPSLPSRSAGVLLAQLRVLEQHAVAFLQVRGSPVAVGEFGAAPPVLGPFLED